MERKYPPKMFWLFVLTNFLFHFFYLFIPGSILCILGIWVKTCLWIGLGILLVDLLVSIMEQIRIRKAAVSQSNSEEFNELMDAFCGSADVKVVKKIKKGKRDASIALKVEDIDLGPYIDSYYHRGATYDAASHQVRELVHFHAGEESVWGYQQIPIPKKIKDLDSLLKYLAAEKGFHLR